MSSDNRRRFSRIQLDRKADLYCNDRAFSCELIDISLNGVLLEKPDNFETANQEQYHIRVFLSHNEYIDMSLNLVHESTNLLGFQCTNIDVESISHLRRLIELNLGDSSGCKRELADLISNQN